MDFSNVKEFLTSWGLHYDTPNGDSNDIPYPHVYERMRFDAGDVGGPELQMFVSSITDTTDGRTYLKPFNWDEIQKIWEASESPEKQKMLSHPLQFEYCECGCHCHSAVSKGIEYSIFNDLKSKLPFTTRRGHSWMGTQIGPKYATWEEAVKAAQDDWDKIP